MSKTKKKKGPWNPLLNPIPKKVAEDLALPRERLQHTEFDVENVSIGHHRLREKSMLTPPALLSERRAIKTAQYVDQGQELPKEGIRVPETPSDRAVGMNKGLLWSYLSTRTEDISGKVGSTNFEKSSHSSDLNKLPLSENQFNRRRFYNWLRKQPGWRELTDFLDDVAAQCNPSAHSGRRVMSKTEIGGWLIDSDTQRDCKSAVDGALALTCRALAGAYAHFAAVERQEAMAKKRREA